MDEVSYLNLSETESRILQITQGVLSGVAVTLNVLYLIVIKANSERLNATEVLQTCKTFLVLLSVLICMPLEIIVVHGIKRNNLSICLIKDFMERLMLDAYPFVIMAVAITRFRVSFCRGNSAVLITKTSALLTFILCLFPTFISGSFMLGQHFYNDVFQYNQRVDNEEGQHFYECRPDLNITVRTYKEVVLIVFGITPVLVTICTYYRIYYKVTATRSKISILPVRRNQHKSISFLNSTHDSNIKITMSLLITVFTISWAFYIFLAIFSIHHPLRFISFCLKLSKPLIYVIHPLAEGLFLQHKRYKLCKLFLEITSCKHRENKEETSSVKVQIDPSCIRHHSVSQLLSAVQEEKIETISMTSDHQKRSTTSAKGPDVEEELFKGIAPSTCLHSRRMGHPIPPVVSIVDGDGNKEGLELCKSQSYLSPQYRRRCHSHERNVPVLSPYRKRASSHASRIIHCAAFHSSPTIGDRIGVALSANKLKTPKSCLKSSMNKSPSNRSEKLSPCNSCYHGKNPSIFRFSPCNYPDAKELLQTSANRLSAKGTVRFQFSPKPKDMCTRPISKTSKIADHF